MIEYINEIILKSFIQHLECLIDASIFFVKNKGFLINSLKLKCIKSIKMYWNSLINLVH